MIYIICIIIIFAIINLYCVWSLHKSNKQIKEEIQETKKWCIDIINNFIEQEEKINSLISTLSNEYKNNEKEE